MNISKIKAERHGDNTYREKLLRMLSFVRIYLKVVEIREVWLFSVLLPYIFYTDRY